MLVFIQKTFCDFYIVHHYLICRTDHMTVWGEHSDIININCVGIFGLILVRERMRTLLNLYFILFYFLLSLPQHTHSSVYITQSHYMACKCKTNICLNIELESCDIKFEFTQTTHIYIYIKPKSKTKYTHTYIQVKTQTVRSKLFISVHGV